jgi:hypothetical protein
MRRTRIDWQMVMLIFMAVCFFAFMVVLAIAMDEREDARLRELERPVMSIDSIRQRHREMRQMRELKNFEDSVHEFEDGF